MDRLKLYLQYRLKALSRVTHMCAEKQLFDIKTNIQKHVAMLKPIFPRRAIVSIGNYTSEMLHKGTAIRKSEEEITLFINKIDENNSKIKTSIQDKDDIIVISEKAETHYWFNVQQYVTENNTIYEKLKSRSIDKLDGAIIITSTGEGLGSALLPDLTSLFKEEKVNTVAFAILPSQIQPPDAHFNALWSMAKCASKDLTQILIDRDALEGYVGVDRKGTVLKGNCIINYIIELALNKKQFMQEFCELSKSFNITRFTVFLATGASLKVYGSIKNILEAAMLRPLAEVDLSTASILYVLIRMPLQLKMTLPRGKIELALDEWFKEKSSIKSAYVSEPIYVDDGSDRLDIIMFVGGFDLTDTIASMDKKVKDIKAYAVKNGFIKEKEWQELINN